MSAKPGEAHPFRDPLPTLTEDDLRAQGERITLPPPVPIGQLVQSMMAAADGDTPRPRAAEPSEVTLDELPEGTADIVLAEVVEVYLGRLGGRSHVPFTRATAEALRSAPLDHWAGFILSLVDGKASIQDVIDSSSLTEVEALRLLSELRDRRLIDVRPRR